MPSVTFFRASAYGDHLRAYDIHIDGARVGEIWDGGIATFAVAPGDHEVQLHIDWCRSRPVRFTATGDEVVYFSARSKLHGLNLLLALPCVLLMPHAYLSLSQVSEGARPALLSASPLQFILRTGLTWGTLTFILVTLWDVLYRHKPLEPMLVVINLAIWLVCGLAYGTWLWRFSARKRAVQIEQEKHAIAQAKP